jgi:hypothetical protein
MACAGYYTGLMLTMAQTALGNANFGKEAGNSLFDAVSDSIGDFIDSTPFLSDLSEMAQQVSGWGSEAFADFTSMGDGVFNGLGNSLTAEGASVLDNALMTEAISTVSQEILGADISVYLSHVAQANSWTAGRNAIITSAIIDTAEYAYESVNSIDGQITGKLSAVNKALPAFSSELANTGSILNFEDLSELGNPLSLVKNLQVQSGGLAVIEPALLAQGINPTQLNNVLGSTTDLNGIANLSIQDALGTGGVVAIPENTLVADVLSGGTTTYAGTTTLANKGLGQAVYDALGSVSGTNLNTMQSIMGANVSGVTTAQDLLDPSKLFPTSYESLTSTAATEKVESTQSTQASQLITGTAKIYTS